METAAPASGCRSRWALSGTWAGLQPVVPSLSRGRGPCHLEVCPSQSAASCLLLVCPHGAESQGSGCFIFHFLPMARKSWDSGGPSVWLSLVTG